MRKLVFLLVLVAAIAVTVAAGILMAQTPSDDDWMIGLPQQRADGTWDPEYFPASNSFGQTVGVTRTEHVFGGSQVYPAPVYDKDNTEVQVGWMGENGYWAIGQQSPWCTECVSVTEELDSDGVRLRITDTYNEDRTITRTTETTDADGNTTTTVETITEGTDGTPGPTGSVND